MEKKCLIYSIPFLLIASLCHGQEMLVPLMNNPQLSAQSGKTTLKKKSQVDADTLHLPFFDDFSQTEPYPDPGLWADRSAFVNSNMASGIVSVGVATLDILDDKGEMYDYATEQPFLSERLTSHPIDLQYTADDSIYLSFCFEPGGLVNEPEESDSLVLQFWSPVTSAWYSVWKMAGYKGSSFRQVMISITGSQYLQKGFRFRFSNYASLNNVSGLSDMTGNQDFWHIDYVYLNRNRYRYDTVYNDVAFVRPLKSLLVNYEAMPWTHFLVSKVVEMGDKLGIAYRNNGNEITLVTRLFQIKDLSTGTITHSYTGGADNIDAYQTIIYNSNLIYTFQSSDPDTAVFEVRSHLVTGINDYKGNDTLRYLQKFINYYAYDDGTAEKGYGLNGDGTSNARFAYRFHCYTPDTLQAVNMFFCQTYHDASQQEFALTVWNDNNGQPGEIIYQQTGQLPLYENRLNRYHTYLINEPFILSGTFYVGWVQTTDKSLFLGFDIDRVSNDKAFYYISKNGAWLNSEFAGSFMIRPVFGSRRLMSAGTPPGAVGIKIYPTPARDFLFIECETANPEAMHLQIINSMGMVVREYTRLPDRVELHGLPAGLYLARLSSTTGTVVRKFLKIN